MKFIVSKYLARLLPLAYGLCVFLFFWKLFPYNLNYREQFQLFQFTWDYFFETFSHPGGFSNYVARFITQFYLYFFVGALILSCLLTVIQQLVYSMMRRFGESKDHNPTRLFISFLPSLFYWYLFCNENWQTGGIIALLLSLSATLVGVSIQSPSTRRIYLLASTPVLYWLAGGTALFHVSLMFLCEWHKNRGTAEKFHKNFAPYIFAIFLASLLPFIAKHILALYPLYRYFWGTDYFHFTNDVPVMIIFLWVMIFSILASVLYLPKQQVHRAVSSKKTGYKKNKLFAILSDYSIIQILALVLSVYIVIIKGAYTQNLSKKEIMAYDYYSRMQNWERIIEMANRKSPAVPMTVSSLNLALYKTGRLPEIMFNFFQNGPEGLLMTFRRDFMISTVAGEPFWHLGFINTAQRYAFEAMEALPDYQKSVRSIKRLCETNIINGYYEVASKYLNILETTLFYRKWAKETRSYLYNEAKINAHSQWGEIRRLRTRDDYLFSDEEKDMMLGHLFQQNRDNRMAYEYLLAYTLLVKDIENFPYYLQLDKNFTYREIPRSWQEALVFLWSLSNTDIEAIPFPISRAVVQDVRDYANIYTSMQSPETALRRRFSRTFWFYLHFQQYYRPVSEHVLQY